MVSMHVLYVPLMMGSHAAVPVAGTDSVAKGASATLKDLLLGGMETELSPQIPGMYVTI